MMPQNCPNHHLELVKSQLFGDFLRLLKASLLASSRSNNVQWRKHITERSWRLILWMLVHRFVRCGIFFVPNCETSWGVTCPAILPGHSSCCDFMAFSTQIVLTNVWDWCMIKYPRLGEVYLDGHPKFSRLIKEDSDRPLIKSHFWEVSLLFIASADDGPNQQYLMMHQNTPVRVFQKPRVKDYIACLKLGIWPFNWRCLWIQSHQRHHVLFKF